MKLSELIREGAKITLPGKGVWLEPVGLQMRACALGGAIYAWYRAKTGRDLGYWMGMPRAFLDAYPILKCVPHFPPVSQFMGGTVADCIVHLNDGSWNPGSWNREEAWTREAIADWVEAEEDYLLSVALPVTAWVDFGGSHFGGSVPTSSSSTWVAETVATSTAAEEETEVATKEEETEELVSV